MDYSGMKGHGGNIYDFTRPDDIIDFSSNINQYGPPKHALEAAADALSLVRRYPDTNQREVREAFSGWLGRPPGEIVFAGGASDLFSAIMTALRPRRVMVIQPTFADYAICARRCDIPVVPVPTSPHDNFAFPMEEIEKNFMDGDLFIACQPNNPTGRAWTEAELRSVVGLAQSRGGWLLADECFLNLTYPKAFSCLPFMGGVIVVRAITKDFSAPGLRVGFAISDAGTIKKIREALQPWPLNCVGEAFAVACASSPEPFLEESAQKIASERARLVRGLKTLGYRPYNSSVNFILAESRRVSANELYERLQAKRLLIRRCANFPGLDDSFFRIAVRLPEDNDALLCALADMRPI
ncbi:MAG: aminotransferase class I/II-fold pyridoxal phosphate-dependent enzyme [Synergistaceae bacterium]|jgi:threonine-phosphate decarboxylase|nr:aminotransferase class I/II-fold pyridoxal phosphate-dependent enzyme [Synergistaceae bacterium]